MRGRRNPRSAVNLKADITSASPIHTPDMQPHPYPQLPDRSGPPMRSQRTLRCDRRPGRRHRIRERRKERITFSSIDKPTLGRDRPTNQLMMLRQDPTPAAPELGRDPSRTLDIRKQEGN
jgi:hypothetical protein